MDQDVAILSPEKTIITYRLAGLGGRLMAHVLDAMIATAVTTGVCLAVLLILGQISAGFAQGVVIFLAFVVPILYFVLLEGLGNGQTLGKRIFQVRVRMADGSPVTFAAALGRNLLRPADLLPGPYLFGLIAIFTNPRSQRIGDMVANTIVTVERRVGRIEIAAPHIVGTHPLEGEVGELRGMTIEEYHALRRYCDRFPELSPEDQKRLTQELWLPIAERRGVKLLPNVHPIFLAEATVMKYGRTHGVL